MHLGAGLKRTCRAQCRGPGDGASQQVLGLWARAPDGCWGSASSPGSTEEEQAPGTDGWYDLNLFGLKDTQRSRAKTQLSSQIAHVVSSC